MITITQLTQAEKLTLARRVQLHIAELAQLGIPCSNSEALDAVLVAIESERGNVVAKAQPATATAKAVPAKPKAPSVPKTLTFNCVEVPDATLVVEFKEFQAKEGKAANSGYSGKFPTIHGVEFNYVNVVVRKAK